MRARLGALAERGGQTVIGGALSGVGGQALVWILGVPTSILIARALGPQGRGEYYLPVLAAMASIVIFHLSVENANAVAYGERRFSLDQLSRNAGIAALVLGPLAAAAMTGVFLLTRDEVFEGVSLGNFLIAAGTVPFSLHLLWLSGVFMLAKQYPRTQIALVVGASVYLLGAALLYALGELGVTEVLLLYAGSVVVPWALLVAWSRPIAPVRPALAKPVARAVVALGARLHLGQVSLFLLTRFDLFLVSIYLGTTEVGIYSLAVLLADLAIFITSPLMQATIPFQAAVPAVESAPLSFKAARFNLAFALALSAGFAATLWFLIPFVYGEGFSDAYVAVLIRLPGICALAAARPLILLIQRRAEPLLYSAVSVAGFALNLGLGVMLIPDLGINGASLASSIAFTIFATAIIAWGLRVARESPGELLLPQPDDRESVLRMARGVSRLLRGGRADLR